METYKYFIISFSITMLIFYISRTPPEIFIRIYNNIC